MKFVLDEENKNALVAYRIKHAKDTFAEVPGFARFYTQMFNYRISGDYDDFIMFDSEIIEEILPQAKLFIDEIEKLLNTDSE